MCVNGECYVTCLLQYNNKDCVVSCNKIVYKLTCMFVQLETLWHWARWPASACNMNVVIDCLLGTHI